MPNTVTVLDTIEATDLEDGSKLTVVVQSCSEMGNEGLPGLQVHYMGYIVNLGRAQVERWAYQARKAGQDAYLLADHSWNVHADRFVRNWLLPGEQPKVRVEVLVRGRSKPLVREYTLPFQLDA